ncbi:Uncharacterised protein [Bacteroides thetaiotaomicron]|uniref:Uncharacterized protein n=1 Tax=Bacteroides thetaiotaomicron TaxID=818 RepID=A0A174P5T2_BACT4|nr:Uncharacterised protein [Bacteroides thetaiotaomicron]
MICNFMIFSESVGSRACLSAEKQLLGCFFVFMEGDASDVVKRKRERFLSVY